jgi:hypothetical protein
MAVVEEVPSRDKWGSNYQPDLLRIWNGAQPLKLEPSYWHPDNSRGSLGAKTWRPWGAKEPGEEHYNPKVLQVVPTHKIPIHFP